MHNKVFLLLVIIGLTQLLCYSQPKTGSQLKELQVSSIQEIRSNLSQGKWSVEKNQKNQTSEYFDYYLDFKVEKWEQKHTKEWEGTLILYYKEGIPNLIVYQTTHLFFTNLQTSKTPLIKGSGYKSKIEKQNGLVMEFREYDMDTSHKRFSILIYNDESLNTIIQIEKTKREAEAATILAEKKAEQARVMAEEAAHKKAKEEIKERYDFAFSTGNVYFKQNKFEEAIIQYEIAKKNILSEKRDLLNLDSRIRNCEIAIKLRDFDHFKESGDMFFEQKNYDEALKNYQNAYNLFTDNQYIKDRIENIKDIFEILKKQEFEQSYLTINPIGYKDFKDVNYGSLNSMINNNGVNGSVNYNITIKFDKFGNNLSKCIINTISDKGLQTYINGINLSGIAPSRISDFYIPSKEVLNFNLSWESRKFKVILKSLRIKKDNIGFTYSKYDNEIESFISRRLNRNGIYNFETTLKNLNGINYEDLKLVSYNYNSGPMNFFYSMILPGLGTKKVTNGIKGKGRMTLFLISAVLCVGSKIYSNSQYDRYKNNGVDGEVNYQSANIANKIFLVSGGVAATIYLNDILYVFGRGLKNNNQSRTIRNDLKNGPIYLVKSPLKE